MKPRTIRVPENITFIGKLQSGNLDKSLLASPGRRREDSVEMELTNIISECENWIHIRLR